ncbi:MAG TPA: F420-0--gamma-glutamyl ligase [Clostridiales bacterium]|nr:F420-0--gamma-glutamyl ligase [Clostridiales bacterium]
MERLIGTISRGIRTPIISKGDDVVQIVVDSVLAAADNGQFALRDRDVIGITEAVVARAQGNYANFEQIAKDIKLKFGGEEKNTLGVIFPILSRNRFSVCLKGIAKGVDKIVLMLSYPSDEVGNNLIDLDMLDEKNVNPWTDILTESKYRELFGYPVHRFTGVDYIEYYKGIIEAEGCEAEIIMANDCRAILEYTKNVLYCDVHTRKRTGRLLKENGAEKLFGLDEIISESVDGSGFNKDYGLLGSNKATDDSVKLFPKDCQEVVDKINKELYKRLGLNIEVMIYGDGAFKDPVGGIWELADPVVSPAYTKGLVGQPNEIKLKYLADNDFADLKGEELKSAISEYIKNKDDDLVGQRVSQGTTPRQLTDLIGSLCDLTSGSGDKGTPVVLIQGYFDNFTIGK